MFYEDEHLEIMKTIAREQQLVQQQIRSRAQDAERANKMCQRLKEEESHLDKMHTSKRCVAWKL